MVSNTPAYLARHRLERNSNYENMLVMWSAALGLAAVALMFYLSFRDYVPFPTADEYNVIALLNQNHGHFPANQFWAQHNEHRIPLVRVLILADLVWFHGTNLLPFFMIYLMQATQLFLIVWTLHQWAKWPRWMVATASGLAALALFWPSQWDCFLNPFNLTYTGVFLGCTAAMLFLLRAVEDRKLSDRWLFGAIGAGILAEASLANGLLIWPFLIAMAARFRLGWRKIGILTALAVLLISLYLYGYARPGYHANPSESLQKPRLVFQYLRIYLSGSFPLMGEGSSSVLAILALAGAPAFYLWELFTPKPSPLRLTIASLSALLLGTGISTALGRINFPLFQAASSRYQTPALLFWLFFCLYLMEAAFRYRARYAIAACVIILIFASTIVPSLGAAMRDANRMSAMVHEAVLPIQAGVDDTIIREAIHPDPNIVFGNTTFLKNHDDGFFRDHSYQLLGNPLSRFSLRDPARCFGEVDTARKISDPSHPGWEMEGWAWDHGALRPLEGYIAVTDNATVTGLGSFFRVRPDVAQVHQEVTDARIGWRLYLRGAPDFPAVQIYGILDGGQGVCLIKPAFSLPTRQQTISR